MVHALLAHKSYLVQESFYIRLRMEFNAALYGFIPEISLHAMQ